MVQTLFNTDQPLAKTYNLQPSQQLVNIRSVLASRKRKSSSLSSTSSPVCIPFGSNDDVGKKQKHVYDDSYCGLPSPPVDDSLDDDFSTIPKHKSNQSPPLTPNTTFSTCSSVIAPETNNDNHTSVMEETEDGLLSTKTIKSKLAALREEKHSMFQLLKRLVEQEEQQQQQQQQDLKKKRTSRWSSPTVSPFSYQRPSPSPLSLHQVNKDNTTTSRHPTSSASSFHIQTASHGGQHSTQRSSYLY